MTRPAKPPGAVGRLLWPVVLLGQACISTGRADDAAGAYIDRVLDPAELPAFREEPLARYDERGPPRAYFVEATAGVVDFDGRSEREHGIAASAYWETPMWGAFSLDGGLHRSGRSGDYTTFGSAWLRGLNLAGGWQADHGLGVLGAPVADLQRRQARFFMPVNPMLGVASEWRHPDGLQLHAGLGAPGRFTPGRLSGFESGEGHVASLGGQWRPAPAWEAGVSLISTQGRNGSSVQPADDGRDGDSLFGAAAWSGANSQAQFNLLATRNDDTAGAGSPWGAWLDASTQAGWRLHSYGAFYLRPELNWGGQWMSSDAAGGYYRISQQRMRWSWSASLDHLSPVSDRGADSSYGSGTVRYQLRAGLGLGGSATYRSAASDAWVASLFADQHSRLGVTRYQLRLADDERGESAWQAELSQALPTAIDRRYSASISVGETARSEQRRSRTSALALYGSQDLLARVSLDGSVRFVSATGGEARDAYSAHVGLNWQINGNWRLLATYDRSSTSQRNVFVLEPFPGLPPRFDSDLESFYLTVRYTQRAGRPSAVLGGVPGAPAGFIHGSVFLDENGNGQRDAGETGAADITVLLDDRFSVRTDSQGDFAFPMVATGPYTLRVLTDNLPLPWGFARDEQQVEVGVRRQVRVEFPARR
jgi:hypothetical protein